MKRVLITLFALCLVPFGAVAQGTEVALGGMQQDREAPVEITADALQVNQAEETALYTGNVIVIQGDLRLAAPRVLVVYSEAASDIQRVEATGGVTMVSPEEAAEADRADYDVQTGIVVMTGNAMLTQGPNVLTSDRMDINLDDGTAVMTGRVRSVLQSSEGQ